MTEEQSNLVYHWANIVVDGYEEQDSCDFYLENEDILH